MQDGSALLANTAPGADRARPHTTELVVELLLASLETIKTNREAAAHFIIRAGAVLREAEDPPADERKATGGWLAPWQLKAIKRYVEANLDKRLDLHTLATVARLGPSHFGRSFRKTTGLSPHAWLLARRIARAKTLMLESDATLMEIALAAGFADQSHFSNRFRIVVGIAPAAWRRERKHRSGDTLSKSVATPRSAMAR